MPVLVIALVIILALGVLFAIGYFFVMIVFRLFKVNSEGLLSSSLPKPIKRSLREARFYAEQIRRTAQQYPPGPMRDRLDLTVRPVNDSLTSLNKLEQALAKLYTQHSLAREIRRLTADMERIRHQLLVADREERASLRALLDSNEKHYAALKELQAFQHQAELKIRKISSDLGTTHAEMLLLTARGNFNDNRFQRLDENLQDNLTGLRDILSAMDDMGYSSLTN